jgi:hypothetical protein
MNRNEPEHARPTTMDPSFASGGTGAVLLASWNGATVVHEAIKADKHQNRTSTVETRIAPSWRGSVAPLFRAHRRSGDGDRPARLDQRFGQVAE